MYTYNYSNIKWDLMDINAIKSIVHAIKSIQLRYVPQRAHDKTFIPDKEWKDKMKR